MPLSIPTPEQIAELDPANHITRDTKRELQRMSRASLFFFAKYVFGRHGLNERAHRPLCEFAQQIIVTPNAFGVAEDPRGTGKSNAITIPGVAWCFIHDENDMVKRKLLPLGPSASVLVASYKTPFASIFTYDTRQIMESNSVFQWLFGDLVPESPDAWSKEFFTVARTSGGGYSVMAIGTESGSTSLHPLVLFIDDLINEKNYNSPAEVASQVRWVEHSTDLVETTEGSCLLTENAWTERDVNYALREKNKTNPNSIKFFSRSRIVCDLCENGRPLDKHGNPIPCGEGFIHPLESRPLLDTYVKKPYNPYTMDDVRRLRQKLPSTIWFAQHENNPLARQDLRWREEWLRFYTLEHTDAGAAIASMIIGNNSTLGPGGNAGIKMTPSGPRPVDESRITLTPITSMTVAVALDPGLNRPGLSAVGRVHVAGVGEMWFLLDCSTDKLSPRDQFFLMFDWVLKWQARSVGFENVALQGYIRDTIPTMADAYERERGRTLPHWLKRPSQDAKRIIGITASKREGDKISRTDAGLSPIIEQRLLAVRRDQTNWIDEFIIFDKGKNIDGLESTLMAIKAIGSRRLPTDIQRAESRDEATRQRDIYESAHQGAIGYGEGI